MSTAVYADRIVNEALRVGIRLYTNRTVYMHTEKPGVWSQCTNTSPLYMNKAVYIPSGFEHY